MLPYVPAPGTYHADQGVKCLKNISLAESEIQFRPKVLEAAETLGCVDYMGDRNIASAHLGITELDSIVSQISFYEVI